MAKSLGAFRFSWRHVYLGVAMVVVIGANVLMASAAGAVTTKGTLANPGAPRAPTGPTSGQIDPGVGAICGGFFSNCPPNGGGCMEYPTQKSVTNYQGKLYTLAEYLAAGSPGGPAHNQNLQCATLGTPGTVTPPSAPVSWSQNVGSQPSGGTITFPGTSKWLVYNKIKASVSIPSLPSLDGCTPAATVATGTYVWCVTWTDMSGNPNLVASDMIWDWGTNTANSNPTCSTAGATTTCTDKGEYVHVVASPGARVKATYSALATCEEIITPAGSATANPPIAATCTPHNPGVPNQDTVVTSVGPSSAHLVNQFEAVGVVG